MNLGSLLYRATGKFEFSRRLDGGCQVVRCTNMNCRQHKSRPPWHQSARVEIGGPARWSGKSLLGMTEIVTKCSIPSILVRFSFVVCSALSARMCHKSFTRAYEADRFTHVSVSNFYSVIRKLRKGPSHVSSQGTRSYQEARRRILWRRAVGPVWRLPPRALGDTPAVIASLHARTHADFKA